MKAYTGNERRLAQMVDDFNRRVAGRIALAGKPTMIIVWRGRRWLIDEAIAAEMVEAGGDESSFDFRGGARPLHLASDDYSALFGLSAATDYILPFEQGDEG